MHSQSGTANETAVSESPFCLAEENEQVWTRHWNQELLAALDWHRFHELVRALLHRAGVGLKLLRCRPDGLRVAGLRRRDAAGHESSSLLALAGWERSLPGREVWKLLEEEKLAEGATSLVWAQPWMADGNLRLAAARHGADIVDASVMLHMLGQLPTDEAEYLIKLFTSGAFATPSCPLCHRPMEQRSLREITSEGNEKVDHIVQGLTELEADLTCHRLLVPQQSHGLFHGTVRAYEVEIVGMAQGNFICKGLVRIHPGAVLRGTIAARAVCVEDGGVLDGNFAIQSPSELEALWEPSSGPMAWSCSSFPKCKGHLNLR
jgi:cytoskeletal protein CcmA (bactofilin family)